MVNKMKRLKLNVSRQFQSLILVRHADMIVALLVATMIIFIDSIFRFNEYRSLFESLPLIGYMKFYGALIGVYAQTVAILLLIMQFPKFVRMLAILFIVFIVLVQMSYFLTLNRYMTSNDLLVALTVPIDEIEGAVISFFNPIITLCAIPYFLSLFILLLIPYRFCPLKHLVSILTITVFLVVSNYVLFAHGHERYFHLNPPTSFIRSVFHYQFQNIFEYHGPRDKLPDLQITKKPKDSIIYIIDESIRGSNLSLNGYSRPTTPFLQTLEAEGRLKNLGICVSASTFSYITNAYLISGHNKFPDKDYHTAKNPTIFDYAKKMGYKTVFIDVNGCYLTIRTEKERKDSIRSVDLWMTVQSFDERIINNIAEQDLTVARFLSNLLNDAGGYFIVVNKKGLHFPYRARYPDNLKYMLWKPVMEPWESIDPSAVGRMKLVNTYDNGIRYAVDEFFQVLVSNIENQNYIILYTSDHGQTLSEHGQIYTHAQADKVVVDVPEFFIISQYHKKKEQVSNIPDGIRVSHLNNFATLLDLMEVPMSLRVYACEKSIFDLTLQDNKMRYYLSGNLYGLAGNYVVEVIPSSLDDGWGTSNPVNKSKDFLIIKGNYNK